MLIDDLNLLYIIMRLLRARFQFLPGVGHDGGDLLQRFFRLVIFLTVFYTEIMGPIFQCFILIFPLGNGGIVVLESDCQTNHFMFCVGEIQVLVDGPIYREGILKKLQDCARN